MFIQTTKDNKGGRDGFYCSLVKSVLVNGKSVHRVQRTFGFIPRERVPYLKACFADGDPEEVLRRERAKLGLTSEGSKGVEAEGE